MWLNNRCSDVAQPVCDVTPATTTCCNMTPAKQGVVMWHSKCCDVTPVTSGVVMWHSKCCDVTPHVLCDTNNSRCDVTPTTAVAGWLAGTPTTTHVLRDTNNSRCDVTPTTAGVMRHQQQQV
ncbi:hypothetical protein Pcinc_024623 [Petrolisthes cinctipes]|uniref:Uncharacterized protein n=1 Tax=Petrolisthes cinctipes TaxID=88211 RepID=A0AAE1FAK9_PETCI|nr:hypothetical protein Pcinc_024623 [Petrolisthes cinctipes]